MAAKVVDASAVAALLFGEPDGERVAAALGDSQLLAPALLNFELANVCTIKCRRHPEQRSVLIGAFELRKQLLIEEVRVDFDRVLNLAGETGLTAYDASYLWLAHVLGAELVTLDQRLAKAATSVR